MNEWNKTKIHWFCMPEINWVCGINFHLPRSYVCIYIYDVAHVFVTQPCINININLVTYISEVHMKKYVHCSQFVLYLGEAPVKFTDIPSRLIYWDQGNTMVFLVPARMQPWRILVNKLPESMMNHQYNDSKTKYNKPYCNIFPRSQTRGW